MISCALKYVVVYFSPDFGLKAGNEFLQLVRFLVRHAKTHWRHDLVFDHEFDGFRVHSFELSSCEEALFLVALHAGFDFEHVLLICEFFWVSVWGFLGVKSAV